MRNRKRLAPGETDAENPQGATIAGPHGSEPYTGIIGVSNVTTAGTATAAPGTTMCLAAPTEAERRLLAQVPPQPSRVPQGATIAGPHGSEPYGHTRQAQDPPLTDDAERQLLAQVPPQPSLLQALKEALDEWDNASLYKGDYLREKHGDVDRIAELRKLLELDAACLDSQGRTPSFACRWCGLTHEGGPEFCAAPEIMRDAQGRTL